MFANTALEERVLAHYASTSNTVLPHIHMKSVAGVQYFVRLVNQHGLAHSLDLEVCLWLADHYKRARAFCATYKPELVQPLKSIMFYNLYGGRYSHPLGHNF